MNPILLFNFLILVCILLFIIYKVVDENYTGPHLPKTGSTPEFAIELMKHFRNEKALHKKYAYMLILEAKTLFSSYDSLVHVKVPQGTMLTVCGDTHGQFYDLLNIFEMNGYPSETNAYLFNGDFVDRGSFSVEVILTLIAWKLALPNHLFLARGNHETLDMNQVYGFEGEVKAKFNSATFMAFTKVFNALPLAHVIENKILVVHGGLFSKDNVTLEDIRNINRFKQPGDDQLMSDLLWADPCSEPGRCPSKRGIGFQFGPDITEKFLAQNNLTKLIRSHEMKSEGYEITHNGKCITIFSAPNYCDAMGNKGAYINIDSNLDFTFRKFTAVSHPKVQPMCYSPLGAF
ncbi:Serine/threonine-protein phosphatase 5 [Coelomomyces lativittatus]|nr:Serine/threonine-protein phosphatase 5 [Coelomomyces lativittatus]